MKSGFVIGQYDVSEIAQMVLARERFAWRPANAALWAQAGPFLARHGIRPKAVFHVYENQTWEKGLRHGLRRALPATRIVGCQQSPFSELYPNMIPSSNELENGRWPDCVLALGRNSERKLSKVAGAARVKVGGLMRQDSVFSIPEDCKPQHASVMRLLCATGPNYQESLELISKVHSAVASLSNVSLLINFHPLTSTRFRAGLRDFVTEKARGSAKVEFTDAPMRDLLDLGVQALFYGDTNAGFDAIAANAHAVHVGRDHNLSFDKLPNGLSRRTWTTAEIVKAIEDLRTPSAWPSFDRLADLVNDCFSAPNNSEIIKAAGLSRSPTKAGPNPETETVLEK